MDQAGQSRAISVDTSNEKDLQTAILATYGAVLDSAALARVLGFPSSEAVRSARRRGTLPIHMFRLPNRKGWFASSVDVATWLQKLAQRIARADQEAACKYPQ